MLLDESPELRYCAFLDILGFKKLLERVENPAAGRDIESLISVLNFMAEEVVEPAYGSNLPVYTVTPKGVLQEELGDLRMISVSDSMIISAEHTANGFKALCRKVTKVWIDLAWDGVFCRGAIAEGPLFHHGTIIFGSGYLKALDLEKAASMPRVIISGDAVQSAGGFPSVFPLRPPTIELGPDGLHYLRYFPWWFFPPYASNWSNYLFRIRQHIVSGLQNGSSSIRRKYEFLRDEFNFTISQYREALEPGLQEISLKRISY